jgi:hypothetical protein
MDWPNGKRDVPDAVAMSITLLDPYAALAFEVDGVGELEVDNLAKDQYPPLEEVLGEDWASAP